MTAPRILGAFADVSAETAIGTLFVTSHFLGRAFAYALSFVPTENYAETYAKARRVD